MLLFFESKKISTNHTRRSATKFRVDPSAERLKLIWNRISHDQNTFMITYVVCVMFDVLFVMFYVLCFRFHVLCFRFYFILFSFFLMFYVLFCICYVSCFMFDVLCSTFNVLCFVFHVPCSMFYVLCFMFYVWCFMFYVLWGSFRGGSAPRTPPTGASRGGSFLELMGPLGSSQGPLYPYIMVLGDFHKKIGKDILIKDILTDSRMMGQLPILLLTIPTFFFFKQCLSDSGLKPYLVIGRFWKKNMLGPIFEMFDLSDPSLWLGDMSGSGRGRCACGRDTLPCGRALCLCERPRCGTISINKMQN